MCISYAPIMDPSSMPGLPSDPNQIMSRLQSVQDAGQELDEISPDHSVCPPEVPNNKYTRTVTHQPVSLSHGQDLMRKVKKEKGQPTEDVPTEEITPEPW